MVGFAGWFHASRDVAERWLRDEAKPTHDPEGDCVVLNAVAAETPAMLSLLARNLHLAHPASATL